MRQTTSWLAWGARLLVLLGLGVPGVGLGATVAVFGVHDPALSDDDQAALVASIRAAVELSGRHRALSDEALQQALAGREELVLEATFLADGRRLLEDGRILYQQAQPDAPEVLEAAVASLAEGAVLTGSVRDLWEAWMLLATARLSQGRETAARDAVGAAVALQPARVPDPASFPPDVIALFRGERELVLDEAGSLEVTVDEDVAEATVWIDGREVGVAPVALTGVPAGEHHLRVRTADGRFGRRTVELAPDGAQSVRVAVGAPQLGGARESLGGRSQQTAALYRALAVHTRADLLLLVGRVDDVMQLQLFDRQVDAFGEPLALTEVGDAEEIGQGVVRLLSGLSTAGHLAGAGAVSLALPLDVSANAPLSRWLLTPRSLTPVVPVPEPLSPEEPSEPVPGRKKWPVYVGVGVGAAVVVVTATVLGVVLGGGGGDPTTVERPVGTITVGPPRSL